MIEYIDIDSFLAFFMKKAIKRLEQENMELKGKKEELERQLIQWLDKLLEQPTRKQVVMILETRRKYLKRRVTLTLLPEIERLRRDHSKIYNQEQRDELVYETNQLNNEITSLEELIAFYHDPDHYWEEKDE